MSWKGLQTERPPVFLSFDQVERMLLALLEPIAAWRPEAVAGITRGGMIPATILGCHLGLDVFAIAAPGRYGAPAWRGAAPSVGRLLVVDDCCSTGRTLARARALAAETMAAVATAAIVFDPELATDVPDFAHPMRELFRLPWERGETTPTARAARAMGRIDPALEVPFYAIEPDVLLSPSRPIESAERSVAVSGRPETERVVLRERLAQAGFGGIALECRPDDTRPDAASIAAFKAQAATRWGCTHLVESDPSLSIRIAALAPHLVVSWSSPGGQRFVIGAASAGAASA